MSFHRERSKAIIRRGSRRAAEESIKDQEEEGEEDELERSVEVGSPRHVMSAGDRDQQGGASTKTRGGQMDHKVYEQQLEILQAQLEATMIEKMEMEKRIRELEEDRSGKKQHQSQKKELEKLARENEELKERLKDLTPRSEATPRPEATHPVGEDNTSGSGSGKRSSLVLSPEPTGDGAAPTALRRWVKWTHVSAWDWLCQFASDFSEDAPRSDGGGLKDDAPPLTVKRLKSNLTRLGKASKPLREFATFLVDVLRFKNKSETLVVFLVYMYCVWNGWVIQLLLLLFILKLSLNYLYESHLAEQFGFHQVAPSEESDSDMGLGDTINLVKQVAQSVQNIAEQVADALEKLTNLMQWHPAHATTQLYRMLWAVFVFSLVLPNGYVLSVLGLFLGIKLFIIDNVYRNYPKVKERYDSVAKMYKQLLTHDQLATQSITEGTPLQNQRTPASRQLSLAADPKSDQDYCAITADECPDFCTKFGLDVSEQPLVGWLSGKKCTLMDRERPLIGSKGGTLYLTHSCLCFESKSFEKTVVHLADIASVGKSKPFSFLPGSGMAIEINRKLTDKPLLFGAILNRDQVLDGILEQGFLLGLAWGQDRNQALQSDPLTTTTTPTGPSEEDILDSELNESSL